MKHEHARIAVYVMAAALVALVVSLVCGIAVAMGTSSYEFNWVIQRGLIYLSIAGMIAIFLIAISVNYELASVDGNPRTVLADLAHRLRVSRYRVKEDRKGLKVQVTSTTAIRITAKVVEGRTLVRYKTDQTASGWTVLIILLFMSYLAPISVALAVYAAWEVQRFAQKIVVPRIVGAKPIAEEEPRDMIRATLIDGLSEGYRLSSEAYEAQYSNYQDGVMGVVAGAIFVWFLTFMALVEVLKNQPLYHDVLSSLVISLVLAVAFCIPAMMYLTSNVKARASEFRSWSERLLVRLGQETSSEPPKDVEPSVFELLDDVSKQIPRWMKVMRRAGMFTDPWTWWAIFMLAYLALMLLLIGISYTSLGLTFQATVIAGGLATALCCFLLYRRWRTEAREEESAVTTSWESRLQVMKSNMLKHLEEL
jgi:hypothetical protein